MVREFLSAGSRNTHCANTDLGGGSPTLEEEEPLTKKREEREKPINTST